MPTLTGDMVSSFVLLRLMRARACCPVQGLRVAMTMASPERWIGRGAVVELVACWG